MSRCANEAFDSPRRLPVLRVWLFFYFLSPFILFSFVRSFAPSRRFGMILTAFRIFESSFRYVAMLLPARSGPVRQRATALVAGAALLFHVVRACLGPSGAGRGTSLGFCTLPGTGTGKNCCTRVPVPGYPYRHREANRVRDERVRPVIRGQGRTKARGEDDVLRPLPDLPTICPEGSQKCIRVSRRRSAQHRPKRGSTA